MNAILLGERGDGKGGGGGGRGRELAARTRKGTDLTHYTCFLSIILSRVLEFDGQCALASSALVRSLQAVLHPAT